MQEISYFLIFGKPLIMYIGLATITLVFITASIGFLSYTKRLPQEKFKWHPRLAALALIFALIHGTLGVLAYL